LKNPPRPVGELFGPASAGQRKMFLGTPSPQACVFRPENRRPGDPPQRIPKSQTRSSCKLTKRDGPAMFLCGFAPAESGGRESFVSGRGSDPLAHDIEETRAGKMLMSGGGPVALPAGPSRLGFEAANHSKLRHRDLLTFRPQALPSEVGFQPSLMADDVSIHRSRKNAVRNPVPGRPEAAPCTALPE